MLVSTADPYNHLLPGFAWCFNKYWSKNQRVTVLGYSKPPPLPDNFEFHSLAPRQDKPFTFYLGKYIATLEDKYFVFTMVDYWLVNQVDFKGLAELERAIRTRAVKADLRQDTTFKLERFDYSGDAMVIPATKEYNYTDLQVSIWRTSFMAQTMNMMPLNPWQYEGLGDRMRKKATFPVVAYRTSVAPSVGWEGVYIKGKPLAKNIERLARADRVALENLGYRRIMSNNLEYDPRPITVI